MNTSFTLSQINGINVVGISGNILSDLDFEPIEIKIDEFIQDGMINLILDLEKVALINSLGVKNLIKTFTKCRNAGGEMYIVNISEKINHVLMLTKLNAVLNIATSVKEAEQNILENNES